MEIINDTPFTIAPIPGRIPFPGHSLTLAVKATYVLAPGKSCVLSSDQLRPAGDTYYPDDPGGTGALYYGSDFTYFKPAADFLLAGTCWHLQSRPEKSFDVAFGVGNRIKTLMVPGTCSGIPGSGRIFGPIPVHSPQRLGRMGRFDGRWQVDRWPWFPEDFDFAHFNQAWPDQQVQGGLKGDEHLYFRHLDRDLPEFKSSLPGIRVRCFVQQSDCKKPDCKRPEGPLFAEVAMNLDTLWANTDSKILILVWRGWTTTGSADHEEIDYLYILSEPLETKALPLDHYREKFIEALDRENRKWEPGPLPPGPDKTVPLPQETWPSGPVPSSPGSAGTVADWAEDAVEDTAEKQNDEVAAFLAGLDPLLDGLDPVTRQEVQSRQKALVNQLLKTDPEKITAGNLENVEILKRSALDDLGFGPDHIPAPSPKARAEQVRLLRAMGLGADEIDTLGRDPSFQEFQGIMAAAFPKRGLDPENLEPLILQAQALSLFRDQADPIAPAPVESPHPEVATPAAAPLESGESAEPNLTRRRVEERAAARESFQSENFTGLDLSGLDLSGLDFANAIFHGAVLRRARLDDAVFEKAVMTGADLRDCQARDTLFVTATLTGADFSGADASGADFSEAVMDQARFSGAILREARLERVRCTHADFSKADLTGARAADSDFSHSRFQESTGAEAIFRQAVLKHTDFSFSTFEGANFKGADLEKANLGASNLKFARFAKAILTRACLVRANLFQGSLKGANLDGTDLRGACLYGVEFLNSRFKNTLVAGADLTMTKLAAGKRS
ncbi:DUF2169 domain-containing protein [uncultured Desulfobacter sp.]|uniref:DUF2169 domain-containing protein n=1 Tax=uncultured Desulfobacter sp. TaxID=240139 RepID=UPI002AAA878B|nr:DUF2169 domain-containing protein [uncultured Desulfobacter sp.]